MSIFALFPLFIAGIYLYRCYRHAYIINETKHDGKLKIVKIPVKWQKLFYLKGENFLLWSVIEQIIGLVGAFSSVVIGYILYAVAPVRAYALFCMLTIIVGAVALAINDFYWMRRHRKGREVSRSTPKRCFICELETAFHNKLPVRKVYVLSAVQGKEQKGIYKVRCGKWSKREYDAMAAKGYTPEVGTYVKAAYTKNKADYSFVLMSDRK